MNRQRILLGVVGDSAAGKTTLTKGIVEALGEDQVTAICSDDYHRYNRQQRKDKNITALHPDCNHIDIMEQHFRLLREGQPILKPVYNHSTGDFDAPQYIEPTKYVIVEGLLPLHTRRMRLCFDVKVFLAPDEALRTKWKVNRDTGKRGYTAEQVLSALEKRKDDSPQFIHPQQGKSDMVVRFYPPEAHTEETGGHLNVQLVLQSSGSNPDLIGLLSEDGKSHYDAMNLSLGRYKGKPVDFLDVDGDVTAEQASELEELIKKQLSESGDIDVSKLGTYQNGLEESKSYPLALTQMLIAYQLLTASKSD